MKALNYIKRLIIISGFIICCLFITGTENVSADEASNVSVQAIDYEMLYLKLDNGSNSIVYMSTDKKSWDEIDAYTDSNGLLVMDISWVSMNADTTLYFKGNIDETIEEVTLPARNTSIKVTFSKVDGDFTFDNFEDATAFEWRKSTDYNWHTVSLDTSAAAYKAFISKVDSFRTKGIKLCFRSASIAGTSALNVGVRPSKEVTISIPKRANAPSLSINIKKMTINTKETMEYYDSDSNMWYDCDKAMSIADIAPDALVSGGSKTVSLKIRIAETETKPYSKAATITINGQSAAPTVGDSTKDVVYYYNNGKLVLQFPKATKTDIYEYAIVKTGTTYDSATASWKAVKSDKLINISSRTAPTGTKIYVRKKGVAGSVKNGVPTTLPSAEAIINVAF